MNSPIHTNTTWWFAVNLHVKFNAVRSHRTQTRRDESALLTNNLSTSTFTTHFIPSQVKGFLAHAVAETNKPTTDTDTDTDIYTTTNTNTNKESSKSTTFIGVESVDTTYNANADVLTDLMTKFLSLDKHLPRRHYLQIINVPTPETPQEHHMTRNARHPSLHYDLEWPTILKKTHHWMNKYRLRNEGPDFTKVRIDQGGVNRIYDALHQGRRGNVADEDSSSDNDGSSTGDTTQILDDFAMTAHLHGTVGSDAPMRNGGKMIRNLQTDNILSLLDLDHIITVPYMFAARTTGGGGGGGGAESSWSDRILFSIF